MVGGYCPERKLFSRNTIFPVLSAELKRRAPAKERPDITINLFGLWWDVHAAWVAQMVLGHTPLEEEESVMARGDHDSAVTWTSRRGGSRGRRSSLLMRLVGRMEIPCGWCHAVRRILGRENALSS